MNERERVVLLQQKAALAVLGQEVIQARLTLQRLTEQGIPYAAPEMLEAVNHYKRADLAWKKLESEYLASSTKEE